VRSVVVRSDVKGGSLQSKVPNRLTLPAALATVGWTLLYAT
jgi:hypothetical protein